MTDDERDRVAKTTASVKAQLVKWRTWFPNEESIVDVPRIDLLALVAAAGEAEKLRAAVRAAGFAVMETGGDWSIHDVSERGKQLEADDLKRATQLVELEIENHWLRRVVSKAYCVACDAQAVGRVRYGMTPGLSPMPELAELERCAAELLAATRPKD